VKHKALLAGVYRYTCMNIRTVSESLEIGLFCGNLRLFGGNIGLFPGNRGLFHIKLFMGTRETISNDSLCVEYRALLREYGALLREYRALLREYRSTLWWNDLLKSKVGI
jgi:hypothetical protein